MYCKQTYASGNASSIYIMSFWDAISYDHGLDQCPLCVHCWNVIFKTGESVIAFWAHFMLHWNDAVPDRIFNP